MDVYRSLSPEGHTMENMAVTSYNKTKHAPQFGFDCPKCLNKGDYDKIGDDGYIYSIKCECEKYRDIDYRKRMSHIMRKDPTDSMHIVNFKTEKPYQRELKAKADMYVRKYDHKEGLFLGGQSGAGKTHIAIGVLKELMNNGEYVLAITWPSFVRKIKDKWEERQKRINFVIDRPVLLIDDLFQKGTTPTEADIDIAWEIMEARNTQGRPTIITSERFLNEIHELRESLHGRIKAHVGRNVVEIGRGNDRNYRIGE